MTFVCPTCGHEVTAWACSECGLDWTAQGRVIALHHAAVTTQLIERRLRIRLPRWVHAALDACHVVVFEQRRDLGLAPGVVSELERLARRLNHHNIRLTTEGAR